MVVPVPGKGSSVFVLLYGYEQTALDAVAKRLHSSDIFILSATTDREELFRLLPLSDILLLDYHINSAMPYVLRHLAPLISPANIVLINPPDDPRKLVECLGAGARGYLRPDDAPGSARTILKEVHEGHVHIDAIVARALLERYRSAGQLQRDPGDV